MASLHFRIEKLPVLSTLWRWQAHISELALYIWAYLVYRFSRGLVFSDLEGQAVANADRVISVEQSLGFFWESGWQTWAIDNAKALVVFLNWTYIITYWPIIFTIALVLYIMNRRRYYYFRNVVVISLVMALLTFMLFPLASPFKMTSYNFVDTIQQHGPSFYGSPEMGAYYNTFAAMPSLHFTWTIILGVLLVQTLKGWLKLFGVAYPVLTFFAITITGNHFILDAIAGAILAGVAFAVMELGIRRRLFLAQSWSHLKVVSAHYRHRLFRMAGGKKALDR